MRNLIFSTLVLFLFSCAKKQQQNAPQPEIKLPEPQKPQGKIHLLLGAVYKIDGEYQDFEMYPDTIIKPEFHRYVTDNGDSIMLSEFNYFIHDMVLFKTDGDSVCLKDSVFIVKNKSIKREDIFYLTSIPEGDYIRTTFYLGALNNQPQLAILKARAIDFFKNDSQYDYFEFKGLYKNRDTALTYPDQPSRYWKKLIWSISTMSNDKNPMSQKINCPLFTPISVKNEAVAPYLHIRVNMRAMFGYADQNLSLIDIKSNPISQSPDQNPYLINNVFSFDNKGANRMFVNDHIHPN